MKTDLILVNKVTHFLLPSYSLAPISALYLEGTLSVHMCAAVHANSHHATYSFRRAETISPLRCAI